MQTLRALALAFLALPIAFYVVQPIVAVYSYTHPGRTPLDGTTPRDRGLAYEDAAFTTPDGLTLRGWYVPGTNGAAVILVHGLYGNRTQLLPVAEVLHAHGYGTLLFDVRAQGASDGQTLMYGGAETWDVAAAAQYLQTRPGVDPERIGALGFSLGAQMAMLGAARSTAVKAVVADGPGFTTFEDWPPPESVSDWIYWPFDRVFFPLLARETGVYEPLSLRQASAAIAPRPLLLVCGGQVNGECRRARVFAADAGASATLWEIPDASHIQGFELHRAEYERSVTAFLDAALAGR
jgi:pimeloyl-ACP methyl ester carboxylesterase